MQRFPTAGHLASWAGVCPGNHESAGKVTSGRTRHGDAWLKGVLGIAAAAAARSKSTYLRAIPTARRSPGQETSPRCRRTLDPRVRLAHPHPEHPLPRPRSRPLHQPDPQVSADPSTRRPAHTAGLRRIPPAPPHRVTWTVWAFSEQIEVRWCRGAAMGWVVGRWGRCRSRWPGGVGGGPGPGRASGHRPPPGTGRR
jgi:hypothetical protein